MATFYSNTANGYRLRMVINQGSQSIPNNTTVVSYSLTLENTSSTFTARSNANLKVNGSTRWSISGETVSLMSYNSEVQLASGSMTVKHGASGTKTVSASAAFRTVLQGRTWTVPQLNVSGSLTLDPIYRTVWVRHSGSWRRAIPWVKHNGSWRRAIPWVKNSGTWRRVGG